MNHDSPRPHAFRLGDAIAFGAHGDVIAEAAAERARRVLDDGKFGIWDICVDVGMVYFGEVVCCSVSCQFTLPPLGLPSSSVGFR